MSDPVNRREVLARLARVGAAAMIGGASISEAIANARWAPASNARAKEFFVIDAVVHCYNHDLTNYRDNSGIATGVSYGYDVHLKVTPKPYQLSPGQWLHDWQPEETVDQIFLESDTDMMCMHSTPLFDGYKDGLVSNPKGAYLKRKYPDRVVWYAAVDLFDTFDNIKRTIDWVIGQGAVGIKLYPSGFDLETGKPSSWLMDDPKRAFPVFEYALSKGIKHIGVHKLIGYSKDKAPYLGIEDLAGAAEAFPQAWFHLVHGGWTMMDENVALMNKYPNITAVLEGPMFWPRFDVPQFNKLMSNFITKVDIDRVIYATGATLLHPYWILNDFLDYQPPAGAEYKFTDADKAKVLGGNFAKLHGIDIAARRKAIAADKFALTKRHNGLREPFVEQRKIMADAGLTDTIKPFDGPRLY